MFKIPEIQQKIKIYTRTGDSGETSLCDGSRVSKDSDRVEAYGSIDELNSFIGLTIVKLNDSELKTQLIEIEKDLFSIGANLAFPTDLSQESIDGESISSKIPKISEDSIKKIEYWIDGINTELPPLKNFILAGSGNELSATFHVARSICRRAERDIVRLKIAEEVNKNILKYINRLSDYLFTASRLVTKRAGEKDIKWVPNSKKYYDKSYFEKNGSKQ